MSTIDPLHLIDPQSYGERGYPHEAWAQLRRNSPVRRFEAPGWPAFWAITRHREIVEVPTIGWNYFNIRVIFE